MRTPRTSQREIGDTRRGHAMPPHCIGYSRAVPRYTATGGPRPEVADEERPLGFQQYTTDYAVTLDKRRFCKDFSSRKPQI